jgi:exosome complex component RRP40
MSESVKNEDKIILFPGDTFPFDRKLLPYQIFSFKKIKKNEEEKQILSSMKSVILYPNRTKINKSKQKDKKDSKNKNNPQSEENAIIPTMYYGNYYSAKEGDVVIGIISQKTYEMYRVNILANKEASLNSIDFEGATRKSKPNLNVGDVVFARVEKENKYSNVTLTCKSLTNSKGWSTGESTYGELKGGKLYEFNRYLCLKLLDNKEIIHRLKECVEKLEIKIGHNGRIWIKTINILDNPKVFKAIKEGMNLEVEKREVFFNELFNKEN